MFEAFTATPLVAIHVAISLAAIAAGLVAIPALAAGRWRGGWHAAFLGASAATVATGFFFPIGAVTPAVAVGLVSTAVLAAALAAFLRRTAAGLPGRSYGATATAALYLNLFVLLAQLFQKAPAFQALAPTQSEPPFVAAQAVLLLAMTTLGALAVRALRPKGGGAAAAR